MAAKKEQKTAMVAIRLKPSVKRTLEKLAAAEGRSVANYVERLIERAAEAEPD
jgi:predicted DNA-binding protein